jgi:hypothetical protein
MDRASGRKGWTLTKKPAIVLAEIILCCSGGGIIGYCQKTRHPAVIVAKKCDANY